MYCRDVNNFPKNKLLMLSIDDDEYLKSFISRHTDRTWFTSAYIFITITSERLHMQICLDASLPKHCAVLYHLVVMWAWMSCWFFTIFETEIYKCIYIYITYIYIVWCWRETHVNVYISFHIHHRNDRTKVSYMANIHIYKIHIYCLVILLCTTMRHDEISLLATHVGLYTI